VIAGTAPDGITIADLYKRETSIGGFTILRRISDTGSIPRP
jgi:hypothetical protein